MSDSTHLTDLATEILSLMLKKKYEVEKLLDLTREQQVLLQEGCYEEFLTLLQSRQQVIDEIEVINLALQEYPSFNEIESDSINHFAYHEQISEVSAEIKTTFFDIWQLEQHNKQELGKQLENLKKDMVAMHQNRNRQSVYDQRPVQTDGAFLDRKK